MFYKTYFDLKLLQLLEKLFNISLKVDQSEMRRKENEVRKHEVKNRVIITELNQVKKFATKAKGRAIRCYVKKLILQICVKPRCLIQLADNVKVNDEI